MKNNFLSRLWVKLNAAIQSNNALKVYLLKIRRILPVLVNVKSEDHKPK